MTGRQVCRLGKLRAPSSLRYRSVPWLRWMTPVEGDDEWWFDCGVKAVLLMGKESRPFSAAGCVPERPDGTRVRKFDSPKNKLLPPDAAATDVPVTTAGAGVLGEDGAVDAGAKSRGLPGLLVDTGLRVDEAGCEACLLDSAPSEESSFMLAWRGFRGYRPLRDGRMMQSA